MNQSIGKLKAQEGQEDHKAKNCLENLSNKTEDTTAVDRKDIMKTNNNNNTSPTRLNNKDKLADTNRKDESKSKKPNQTKALNNTNNPNKPISQVPTSKKPIANRVSLAPNRKAFSPTTSKIPALKQVSNAKTTLNNKTNTRSSAPEPTVTQLPPSDSKLSINTVEKVEPSASKSNCNPVWHSARVKDNMKMQTARSAATPGPSIQKRSSSNMSTRSTPPPLMKREDTQTNLRKITSIAGDYVNSKMASNKSSRSTSPAKKQQPDTNLRKMLSTAGDQNKIVSLEKKLEEAQTEFFHKMENLKETLPADLKYEYKFIAVTRNDECKLMVKDDSLLKLAQTFPDAVIDFKDKIKKCMDNYFASLMDNLKDTNEESTVINIEAKDKLEKLQILKSNNILSLIDDLCSIQEEGFDVQIVKMQKELQDNDKTLKQLEKTLNDLSKNHEEALFNLGRDMQSKAEADMAHKDAEMKELNRKLKWLEKQNDNLKAAEKDDKADKSHMQEEIKTSKESYATIQRRLHTLELQLTNEKKELKNKNDTIKKLENDLVDKKILETKLADMTLKIQELKDKQEKLDKQDKPELISADNSTEHLQQIAELQNVVNTLESEKIKMETKTEKLEAEVAALVVVEAKLKDAENCMKDLQRKLDTKQTSQDTQGDYVKDVQMEFAKFRQSDAEKRREIEKLKVELSKFQYNICQLEEEIQRGQQLLEVRCELINSLQTNEKTQRIHMEELFAQVAEKNNTINELNGELHTKTEEFRNLFSTISAKQMELSNQEHMIKLLEDSNERSQMLRVKQEEKIGRMEEELAHLKQTISIYQANILSASHGKNVLYAPILPASNGDFNENFYYYASQRRRKRQVDINVKKYEA